MKMNILEIKVIEFNEDFVRYEYSTGETGMSGRKWFPDVEVGQTWKMTCFGALVISCELIKAAPQLTL